MKRKMRLTTVMGGLSAFFIVWVCMAHLLIPHDMNTTSNYCFSDKTELLNFELKLKEEKIPYSQISETTVKISKDNTEQADIIFNQISEQ